MDGINVTFVAEQKRKYTEAALIERLKNILLCHFMVGTAHASLSVVIRDKSATVYETAVVYLAIALSLRRYIMFFNDFHYIHSKIFNKMSTLLRYENVPYLRHIIVAFDVIILMYRFLHYFIQTDLVGRDREMIALCAYLLIPGLILFLIHTAMEENIVYQEIVNPTYEVVITEIPVDPNAGS